MPVYRVKKDRNFTAMSNHHLQNRGLSLRAKGLLSLMLSLPDDWEYSLKGLAAISQGGVDAIRTIVEELEAAGYIVRRRYRDPSGIFCKTEFSIYENPKPEEEQTVASNHPLPCGSVLINPISENPI